MILKRKSEKRVWEIPDGILIILNSTYIFQVSRTIKKIYWEKISKIKLLSLLNHYLDFYGLLKLDIIIYLYKNVFMMELPLSLYKFLY